VRLAWWLALLCFTPAFAQEDVRPQTIYQQAESALAAGDFESAFKNFSYYAERYPASPAHSAAVLGAAKAALYSGRYDEALNYTAAYLELPPTSTQALACLYRGGAFAARYQMKEAIAAYADGFRRASDPAYRQAFITVTERLAAQMDPREARKVFGLDLPPDMADSAWQVIGTGLEAQGQRYLAMHYFADLAEKFAGSPVGVSAEIRRAALEAELSKTIRIGVVTPLSGTLAKYGEEMNQGIALAAKEFQEQSGRQVELMVEDSRSLPVPATRACQSILDREPAAVIGPLTSVSAIGCAAAAAAREVPLIVPAASETELTSLGDHIYCLSPSLDRYGQTLGWFTVETLGLCSHLIFAPDDDYGHRMAGAYRRAVEEAGGEIWRETYYTPGTTDFSPFLRAFKSSFLDTLSDTSWWRAPDGRRYDAEEVAVYPEAIFVPGYVDDLVLLLPQIRFFKVAGRLVGTDTFADEDLMMRVGGNLEDAVFASVEPLAPGALEWQQFSSRYARSYGRTPGRLAALGYDAFKLLTGAMGASLVSPSVMGAYLEGVDALDGASGRIEFNYAGENTRVPLYYIRDKQISVARR
jgi:branched-chain amino acid transport system substrate-binding protein